MQDVETAVVDWRPRGKFATAGELGRWGSLASAAALMAFGISRRSVPGALLAMAAVPLAYRALAGRGSPGTSSSAANPDDTRAALSGDRGIHVRESIRVEKPIEEVYRFWRQLENLPRFMENVIEVTQQGNGRSHWVVRGPAGMNVEWDAEIINEIENSLIAWRSLPGPDVVHAGSVKFERGRNGSGTQLSVHLQYVPPAGQLGALVASAAGRAPARTIRQDLRRFKQLLEAGEIPSATRPEGREESRKDSL